ncbi:hypothetical protein [Humisphaera borealis]|uniref:Uncharacterized protein n=1 Tax=Humisphaera borealis TaxID=2807512 RepID=A0A7M2X1R2_9BACT|nr:hypothetical protein [Humisphaera borealis]QOV91539.1 hypothetical protein IPV69_09340 [Humisphaera borealis]
MTRHRAPHFIALLLLPLIVGCYECRWSAAGKEAIPAGSIAGRWEGTWKSDANGHNGGLRCIISDVTPDSFKADFRATYGWFFSFGYAATMTITAGESTPASGPAYIYFKGEQDIGWLAGGVYQYDGKVGPTAFFCNYTSKDDKGVFQLSRPGGEAVAK